MSTRQSLEKQRQLAEQLPERMRRDYLQWLKSLERRLKNKQPIDQSLSKISKQMQSDIERLTKRRDNIPKSHLNQSLPIYAQREKIIKLIAENQVVIIAGETGSGKTTQLPQLCLDAGFGRTGMIGHTQPRRIAATAVARRIADEMNCELGQEIGYQIRFDKKVSDNSYIKLMTDGVLLNELHDDPLLSHYDVLIVDEAHERSLNIDFILGVLKGILKKRPEFKLLVTSATIDLDKFSHHFDAAPILEVSGRTYPVEMRFRPESSYSEIESFEAHALAGVRELAKEKPGDILIFLPSEQAIRHLADYLRRHLQKKYDILPLYSRLAKQQQQSIFQTHSKARIVLSTNIAETSLTVPGIRYVIDSGLARISRYSTRSKVQRLPIEPISQASANQRAGRCGRMEAGICIRLYSEEDFQQRPEYVEPEILRTNLATVILQMAQLELGAVEQFDFIDPPLQKQINDGIQLLIELQAMEEGRQITALGKQLARLPVDPRIGRILIAAADNNALREVTIITAMIGIQDPRERPADQQQKADENHQRFKDKDSDFVSLLTLWRYFHDLVDQMSWSQVRKRCLNEFLHFQRMREWREQVSQLLHIMRGMGYKVNSNPADYDAIHKSLLTGFLTQVANYDPRGYYLAPRQVKIHIFPASGLFRKPPRKETGKPIADTKPLKQHNVPWIMAAELVETSKNYARMVAKINPEWIEMYALNLLKRQQSEPYWSSRGARAMVKESGLLFGLAVYANRKKPLEQFNKPLAREWFIGHGLVDKGFRSQCKLLTANWNTLQEAEDIQFASRRHDLIVSRDWFIQFYDERLPHTVWNGPSFDKWCRHMTQIEQEAFCYAMEDICSVDLEKNRTLFPDTIQAGDLELAVEYHFEPGMDSDGMHITIPLLFLNQVTERDFQWLVPGLFEGLIIALIRSLPKAKRKRFVPVPAFAKAIIERLEPSQSASLYEQVATGLQKMSGELISPDDFSDEVLPANLRPTFAVINEKGGVIGSSSDLQSLQARFKSKVQQTVRSNQQTTIYPSFPEQGFTVESEVKRGVGTMKLFQGLQITDTGYQIIKSDDKDRVSFLHMQSLAKLILAESQKLLRDMSDHINELAAARLVYSTLKESDIEELLIPTDHIYEDLTVFTLRKHYEQKQIICSDLESFHALKKLVTSSAMPDAVELLPVLRESFSLIRDIRQKLDELNGMKHLSLISALKNRLDDLLYKGFIHTSGEELLRHYPRYLKSISQRLEAALLKPLQERERSVIWDKYWQKYISLSKSDRTQELRHSLEEFHVMIFAQQLGTRKKVSEKRLNKMFAKLG